MTWTVDEETGEITAPWGESIGQIENPVVPNDVQAVAADHFRQQTMADLTTDRIADYAEAWMGDVELV
jgi:hypothetical protein